MASRKPKIEPRVIGVGAIAVYIGKSETWFRTHLTTLREVGFPEPLPVLGGYDRHAVDDWLDRLGRRAILDHSNDDVGDPFLKATLNG